LQDGVIHRETQSQQNRESGGQERERAVAQDVDPVVDCRQGDGDGDAPDDYGDECGKRSQKQDADNREGREDAGDDRYPDDRPEGRGDVLCEHRSPRHVIRPQRRYARARDVGPESRNHLGRGRDREVVDNDHRAVVRTDKVPGDRVGEDERILAVALPGDDALNPRLHLVRVVA